MTATTKTDCTTAGLCHYDSLTRTKFFDGMLLTDESLQAEQTYHREALKRVNRYLWGSGVVCGLEVKWVSGLCIQVSPGVALDCKGNLIELCRCITLDLTKECKDAYPGGCIPKEGTTPIERYLVVRYADTPSDYQPVLTSDDECPSSGQGAQCLASKTREGFCLELREQCTGAAPCAERDGILAYLLDQGREAAAQQLDKAPLAPMTLSPACPVCSCTDSYVGLAKLTIDCSQSTVDVTTECRSYVWTPGLIRLIVCQLFAGLGRSPIDLKEQPDVLGMKPQESMRPILKRYVAAPDRVERLQGEVAELRKLVEAMRAQGLRRKPPPPPPPPQIP